MKYNLVAIVPVQDEKLLTDFSLNYTKNPSPYLELFNEKLEKPLEKYDLNREMPPRKEYLTNEEIQTMREGYEAENPEDLAKHMKEWRGEDGGADQRGIFIITRKNPHGKMDYWNAFEVLTKEQFLAQLEDPEYLVPRLLLMPDLTLVDIDKYLPNIAPPSEEHWQVWLGEIRKRLAQFPRALIVMVKCHM